MFTHPSLAPSQPSTPGSARTFSKGIWKSVYVVTVTSAAITALVPHTFYNGSFPTAPLQDGNHAPFIVNGVCVCVCVCICVGPWLSLRLRLWLTL